MFFFLLLKMKINYEFLKNVCSAKLAIVMLNFDEILLEFRDNYQKMGTLNMVIRKIFAKIHEKFLRFPEPNKNVYK